MVEESYRPKFVGFYWTLSVSWKGMTDNFTSIEQAVRESRTIRYQRQLAHEYARHHGGEIVKEIAYRDLSNDRMTPYIKGEVKKAAELCKQGATLLWVDFSECGWRRHRFISEIIQQYKLDVLDRHVPLPPEERGGFDPAEHFSAWRVREEQERDRRRLEVPQRLREALEAIPEGRGRNRKIAEWLNAREVPTLGGKLEWKDDNVRKALENLAMGIDEEASASPTY